MYDTQIGQTEEKEMQKTDIKHYLIINVILLYMIPYFSAYLYHYIFLTEVTEKCVYSSIIRVAYWSCYNDRIV